ncbi:MAG: hypothetical protein HYX78_01490 [Armatimonadetes bacterium]|nr:hypothetical protein [Armatimonadota bacterium]
MTVKACFFHLWVSALAAALAVPCLALRPVANVGFDSIVKQGVWAPVSVELANQSDSTVNGILVVDQPEYSGRDAALCAAAVTLPSKSKKLYHLYFKPGEYGETVVVRLVRERGAPDTRRVRITNADRVDKLIITVGDRSNRLSFLSGERIPVTVAPSSAPYYRSRATPVEAAVYPGAVAPNDLPDRPAAYESIDMLIVTGDIAASASPKALQAISMWVASGGQLVVSVGPDYRKCQNDFFDELLPVELSGTADLAGMSSLTKLGKQPFPRSAVAVAESSPKDGIAKVLASENAVPLVVTRNYGAGTVVFLAFDYRSSPFRDWNGQTEFWKILLKSGCGVPLVRTAAGFYSEPYNSPPDQLPAMAGVVEANPSIGTPSVGTIVFFLAAYLIVLVPVNYFVLAKKKRLELAWVTTPAIVILFTLGAYGIGYTTKGSSLQLQQATFVEGSSSSRYARLVTCASLFSPARRSYRVELTDPLAVCQTIASSKSEPLPPALLGETTVMEKVPMAMWSSRAFESVSATDLGGYITSDLTLDGDKLTGEVRNQTGALLMEASVVYGDRKYSLRDLGRGASAKLGAPEVMPYIPQAPGSPGYPGYYPGRRRYGPGQQKAVPDALHEFALQRARAAGAPVLVAKARTLEGAFRVRGASSVSATCCAFRLDYKVGKKFAVSADAIKGTVVQCENGQVTLSPSSGQISLSFWGGQNHAIVAFEIPVPADGEVTGLKLEGSGSGTVQIYNCATNKWEDIQFGQSLAAGAAQYVNLSNEARVKVKATGSNSRSISVGLSAEGRRK